MVKSNRPFISLEIELDCREARVIRQDGNNCSGLPLCVSLELEQLAMEIGQRAECRIELIVSNEKLANYVSVTPLPVSRLLSEWLRKGLLVKDRGPIDR